MNKIVDGLQVREGMSLEAGERVEVYYNIQKGGFSIKAIDKRNPNKGKVVAYASNVFITEATFHLNQNKLSKILEIQRKTVYATVKGTFEHAEAIDNSLHRRGYCNPYKTGKFIDWDTQEQIHEASEVYFYNKFFSFLK
ncbi:hypothetical protein BH780_gp238 [Bacillus phage Eldridge]|uniref:Uncharacterized protein n=1 Tax=Bacillus phage Eldridge TaxID=1776293 RepID=A0A109QIX3_9CAUD|nr:hypothetical protein BH780_gp008 [Bacillus phage Eldridge]YP_009274945.1 hypothetical protein BH780_gp238 [Bacillus phage Eldridge]AMB18819.1 hypothetical protein Eldridge_08 [Bacillus phage Eldridge]AMB18821.1 hypothetical protein Eldridge_0241 [Bacillus phage Eldridge]